MTVTVELPEELASEVRIKKISESEIKKILMVTLELWLKQEDTQGDKRFSESAVPLVRRLISQNRALFETLARS